MLSYQQFTFPFLYVSQSVSERWRVEQRYSNFYGAANMSSSAHFRSHNIPLTSDPLLIPLPQNIRNFQTFYFNPHNSPLYKRKWHLKKSQSITHISVSMRWPYKPLWKNMYMCYKIKQMVRAETKDLPSSCRSYRQSLPLQYMRN